MRISDWSSDVCSSDLAGYEKVKALDAQENGVVWLKPAPANNSWALAVRKDVAAENDLSTLEDFAAWVNGGGDVKLAASAEFVESPAALPAFQSPYGFELTQDQIVTLAGGDTSVTIQIGRASCRERVGQYV